MENQELIYTPESHDQVSKELRKQIEFGVCSTLTVVLLYLLAYMEAWVELSLLPLILYNMHQIYVAFKELKQGSFWLNLKSTYNGFIFIHQISDGLAKVSLIFHVQLGQFPYVTIVCLALPYVMNYAYREGDYHQLQHFFHMNKIPLYFMIWPTILLYVISYFTSLSIRLIVVFIPIIIYFGTIGVVSLVLLLFLILLKAFRINISELNDDKYAIFLCFSYFSMSLIVIYYLISLVSYFDSGSYRDLVFATLLFFLDSFIIHAVLILFRNAFKEWFLIVLEYDLVDNEATSIQLPPKLPTAFKRVSEEYYVPITKRLFKKKTFQKAKSVSRPHSEEDESLVANKPKSKESEERVLSIMDSEHAVCSICFENQSNAVILPCGHGGICYQCTLTLDKRCHICRELIQRSLMIKQNSEIAYVPS